MFEGSSGSKDVRYTRTYGVKWWSRYQKEGDFSFTKEKRAVLLQLWVINTKKFLINCMDENPSAVVDQAMETLMEEFEGLSIKKTAVHKFIKEECQLTFKKAQFYSVKRNELSTSVVNGASSIQQLLIWII
jgi:hypothetical protein